MMKRRLFIEVVLALAVGSASLAQTSSYPAPDKVRQELARLLQRPKVPLEPQFIKTTSGDNIVEKGSFVSEAGKRVPTLMIRDGRSSGRLPAIVVLHGTGGTKEGMREWLDGFASRGYLAVGTDARYHGEWVPGGAHGSQEYNEAAIAAWRAKPGQPREYPFWYDTTYDVWRTIDYLVTRPDVDPNRIAVLGVSMGGIEAYYASAVDPRIKAPFRLGSW